MAKFADRIRDMEDSAKVVEYLFNNMTDPNTISFGGGSPAKEALPAKEAKEIMNDVLGDSVKAVQALAYGAPLGMVELRQVICDQLMIPKGVRCNVDNVMIANGGM